MHTESESKMKVIDPGHLYVLNALDGDEGSSVQLRFVKREGKLYPGNEGHYAGTTIQEVCRALIDRVKYVNSQLPHDHNRVIINCLRLVILLLEERAAERHNREMPDVRMK